MEMVAGVLGVGFALVVPQVVGFAASRRARRRPAAIWALAAAATVAVMWGISVFVFHRVAERAHATGRFHRGSGQDTVDFVTPFLMGAHFLIGGVLGALDRHVQRQ
jgi:hypothetical protein